MTQGDDFFTELTNSKPYLKMALEGFAGSGKTYTMAQIAIELHRRLGSSKPIVAFDTEEAIQALKFMFDEAGIVVLRKSSRSLADLMETMRRCRDGLTDILLIDSISHIWEDVLTSYLRRKNRQRLQFEDWGIIKPTWRREFSDPFVRDPYHCLMTGRAGYEYEDEKDEDGKRQIFKSGIKMRAEGETAYEPDILVLMSRREQLLESEQKVWREAMVIKDRSTLIDGKTFRNPTYADFAPAVERLLSNPAYALPKEADASGLFGTEEERRDWIKRRDIALEKVEAALVEAYPGQDKDAKRAKVVALKDCFGTTSWTEMKGMKPEKIEEGLTRLEEWLAARKNGLAAEVAT